MDMQAMIFQPKFQQSELLLLGDTKHLTDVYVYIARVPTDDVLLNDSLKILSKIERVKAMSFRFSEDRNAYITAHALLRSALSCHSLIQPEDWFFETSPSGKPEQVNLPGKLHFNISHTRGMVCCAVFANYVGVDIENVEALSKLESLDHIFSKKEINEISCLPVIGRHSRALIYWTLRESFLKGTGEGIGGLSKEFYFSVDDNKRIFFKEEQHSSVASNWKFATFLIDDYYAVSVSVQDFNDTVQTVHADFMGSIELVGTSQHTKIILK